MLLGAKLKHEFVEKCVAGVSRHLHDGEHVVAMFKTNKLKPMIDLVIVTNGRVLGVGSLELASRGPKLVVRADEIRAVRTEEKRFSNPSVTVDTVWNTQVGLGQMIAAKEDGPLLTDAIESLRAAGTPQGNGPAVESTAPQQATVHSEGAREDERGNVGIPRLGAGEVSANPPFHESLATEGLADELAKLAALRNAGALNEAEFSAAKAAAIARQA